ncbi:MAG: AAA family ATPase, partial [Clostridiales bacterium]|nr:AAA family ATPase [Clostridiales bacterium]
MGKQIRYEKEILEWRKRQFLLRRKYTDTPPGFRNEDQEDYALEQLKKAELEYQKSCEMKLISGYQPSEEIFVGREDILRQVQEALAAKCGPVVLFGVGGMGKSAIAREYLRRRSTDYDHVLLLYADDGIFSVICDDCQMQMTNMQYSKDRYGNRNNYFREKIRALRQIAKEKRLLLVIDNWDRPADKGMDEVFSLECDILVTTRMTPTVWGLREGIPVSGFETTEEWNAFLSAYGKTAHSAGEQRAMEEYCRQVGGHPLLMKLKADAASGVSAGSE